MVAYRVFIAGGVLLLTSFFALGQEEKAASFDVLLEKAKRMTPKVDFRTLRMAYSDTATYNPYDPSRETHSAILKALRDKQYDACLKHVEQALGKNYLDINVHFAAARCQTLLKNQEKAKFHTYFFDGLIRSILASGDGKAPASAYVVIAVEEEYALLDAVGLRRISQTLLQENGVAYDLIVAKDDASQKEYRIYFNIDRQTQWLRQNGIAGSK